MGFKLSGAGEALLFWKWLYWKNGISGRQFREEWIRDVHDIMDVNNAVSEKELREKQMQKLISQVKY